MIALITGKVLSRENHLLVIEAGALGYEVHVPLNLACDAKEGSEMTLHTHFVVREDAQLLFGFADKTQRNLFRELIKISGVGPKMGLAILSTLSLSQLLSLVQHEDVKQLQKIPGVGKKTAERLLVELKSKLSGFQHHADADADAFALQTQGVGQSVAFDDARQDAQLALESLGYRTAEADKLIRSIYQAGMNADEIIRLCLQSMAR